MSESAKSQTYKNGVLTVELEVPDPRKGERRMILESIHLRNAALGHVRIEEYDGREHLVLPVVALIGDQIIHAVNASHPERVTVDTLIKAAESFVKKPVVLGHPVRNGKQVSAASADVLESHGIGTIIRTRMDGPRLLMDVAIDPVKAEKVGGKQFVSDLRENEPCDVSVGAFVTCDTAPGELKGKKFAATWLQTLGDHLAVLWPHKKDGVRRGVGACSWESGCGIRAAMHLVTAEGFTLEEPKMKTPEDLQPRIDALVAKVAELKAAGAQDGHPFYGNQHTDGSGVDDDEDRVGGPQGGDRGEDDDDYDGDLSYLPKSRRHEGYDRSRSPVDQDTVKIVRGEHKGKRAYVTQGVRPNSSFVELRHQNSQGESLGTFNASDLKVLPMRGAEALKTAECAHLEVISTLLTEASALLEEATDYADALAETPEGEEVDAAQLDAINTLCMAITSALSAVSDLTFKKRYAGHEAVNVRAAEIRAAIGKSISAANMKVIQAAHDSAHDMHDHTTALGAECNGMKLLAEHPTIVVELDGQKIAKAIIPDLKDAAGKDCAACNGTGRVDKGGTQVDCTECDGNGTRNPEFKDAAANLKDAAVYKDCPACKGSGNLDGNPCEACDGKGTIEIAPKVLESERTPEELEQQAAASAALLVAPEATLKAACGCHSEGDTRMTPEAKTELINALVQDKHSGFTKGDEKFLEGATDERLESFKVAAASRAEQETTLKAAAAKEFTAEEFMKVAPAELKALITRSQREEGERKAALITTLKTAQGEYSEAELSVMDVEQLTRMARMAKVEDKVDYTGRGVSRTLAQKDDESYEPPNPYAEGLKALQGSRVN